MALQKFGRIVMKGLHDRSFSSSSLGVPRNPNQPQPSLTGRLPGSIFLGLPLWYWFLFQIDFCGISTMRKEASAIREEDMKRWLEAINEIESEDSKFDNVLRHA